MTLYNGMSNMFGKLTIISDDHKHTNVGSTVFNECAIIKKTLSLKQFVCSVIIYIFLHILFSFLGPAVQSPEAQLLCGSLSAMV